MKVVDFRMLSALSAMIFTFGIICPALAGDLRHLGERPDPDGLVYRMDVRTVDGRIVISNTRIERIPRDALQPLPPNDKRVEGRDASPDKIHPLLKEWLAQRSGDERELLIVRFRDDLELPTFPAFVDDEPLDSRANQIVRRRIQNIVRAIEGRRRGDYGRLGRVFRQRFDAEVQHTYWLIKGFVTEMPLASVRAAAQMEEVQYLQPVHTRDTYPADSDPLNDVEEGRARILSDPWASAGWGQKKTWLGLLDTGIRLTHDLFNNPNRIGLTGDCVSASGLLCAISSGQPEDLCDHGTPAAGILVGNANLGSPYQGVIDTAVNSWRTNDPPEDGECFLNSHAAVRAFQTAVWTGNKVIVANMQSGEHWYGSIAEAANRAFDTGAVVVAANGNFGPAPMTVRSPASAPRALGVGSRNVKSWLTPFSQGRGPVEDTPDWRFKPDIQAPTATETASSASDTALKVFTGTSASAPFAGGAAMIWRDVITNFWQLKEAGHTYAQMILTGQRPFPDFDNVVGAGPLLFFLAGGHGMGKLVIPEGQKLVLNYDLSIWGDTDFVIDAAIWWPIPGGFGTHKQFHRDLDLYVYDPNGWLRAKSDTYGSVFERARATKAFSPSGVWRIEIHGHDCTVNDSCAQSTSPQTVYFGVLVQPRS